MTAGASDLRAMELDIDLTIFDEPESRVEKSDKPCEIDVAATNAAWDRLLKIVNALPVPTAGIRKKNKKKQTDAIPLIHYL